MASYAKEKRLLQEEIANKLCADLQNESVRGLEILMPRQSGQMLIALHLLKKKLARSQRQRVY